MQADLILTGGTVRSPEAPEKKYKAVAVVGGRILEAGSDRSVKRLAGGSTRVLDLRGGALLPGFVDCHSHFVSFGLCLSRVDARGATSAEETAERVRKKAAENLDATDEWILGRGWDSNPWSAPPHRKLLDAAAPGRKVFLRSHCGHAGWASSAALDAAGLTPSTPDPFGGKIDKDEDGRPTGILLEAAAHFVQKLIPEPSEQAVSRGVLAAQRALHQAGITGIHDCSGLSETFPPLSRLAVSGKLRLRVLAMPRPGELDWLRHLPSSYGFGSPFLKFGPVKMFADGSLTARTAWIFTDSGTEGIPTVTPERLGEWVAAAASLGYPAAIHAIGDAAVRMALDSIERSGDTRLPNRIEHAQLVSLEDIPRFKALNVTASVQPSHLCSDWPKAEATWGTERSKRMLPLASLLRSGAMIISGSDLPVEKPSAVEAIYAAVLRVDREGKPEGGWNVQESISVADAVRASTLNPALLYGEKRGRIAPGFDADFTVFSDDPYEVPVESLRSLEVTGTVVAGEVVHWS